MICWQRTPNTVWRQAQKQAGKRRYPQKAHRYPGPWPDTHHHGNLRPIRGRGARHGL